MRETLKDLLKEVRSTMSVLDGVNIKFMSENEDVTGLKYELGEFIIETDEFDYEDRIHTVRRYNECGLCIEEEVYEDELTRRTFYEYYDNGVMESRRVIECGNHVVFKYDRNGCFYKMIVNGEVVL